MKSFLIFVICGGLGLILFWGMSPLIFPSPVSKHYILWGVKETGAINLVSSIYLGYRAFDTLGETVILLLTVLGSGMLLGRRK